MERHNLPGPHMTRRKDQTSSLMSYSNTLNFGALPQTRPTVYAPMSRSPLQLPPRPSAADDVDTQRQKDLVRSPMRSDSARLLVPRGSVKQLQPQSRSAGSAPVPRPVIKPIQNFGLSSDDDESEDGEDLEGDEVLESDEDESENDYEASDQEDLVESPMRSDSVRPPVLRGFATPLNFSRFQTRFLCIVPERSAELSCELKIESLINHPAYVALSYHWGDQTPTRHIFLDGRATKVTASLEAALKALRTSGARIAWVDALCINQPDEYEKVYQLRQMGLIFSEAAKVVAWLGPAANDSYDAMQALATIQFSDRNRLAITHLLQRPYWDRAWVIQELARAAMVEVWCGNKMLPWDLFLQGAKKWWSHQRIRVGDFDHPIMVLQYFRNAEADVKKGAARMLLSVAMVRALDTKATLNRDKIYALLGLTRDGTDIVPTPNYEQEDATVFDTVLRHMIIAQGQLNLVFLARVKRARGGSPSWLPRWNDTPPLERIPWLVRCFEQINTKDNFVECSSNNILKVIGQLLGRLQVNSHTSASVKAAVSMAQATGLLQAIAWQLLKCRWNDHRLGSVPSVHDLASIWTSRSPFVRARFPKLRKWYEDHSDVCFATTTPRASVTALRENPQVLLAERSFLTSSKPSEAHWLDHLEIAVSAMLQHKMSLRVLDHLGSPQIVMVPQSARENHFVARLNGCSLPVVLCGVGDSRYTVIGEVVEVYGWFASNSRYAVSKNAAVPRYGDDTGALGGDWRLIDRARWVPMYLV